jgi:uncharacterized protein
MMDPHIREDIQSRLETLVTQHQVAIPLAIESGSRAWGFPSPDSDYDCRFVFVRPLADYLRLNPQRDVIELPMTPVFDINGWDLAKALKLLLKGNAVIIEWLTSPLDYRVDQAFRDAFLALARAIADRDAIATHYLHLARHQVEWITHDADRFPLKKLFYGLRPLMALRWLDAHPDQSVAPMHFPTLCEQIDLAPALRSEIDGLLHRKAITRELGEGPVPVAIRTFIAQELATQRDRSRLAWPPAQDRIEMADAFFRNWVERFSTG